MNWKNLFTRRYHNYHLLPSIRCLKHFGGKIIRLILKISIDKHSVNLLWFIKGQCFILKNINETFYNHGKNKNDILCLN